MMDKLGDGKMMQIAMKNFDSLCMTMSSLDNENPNYLEPCEMQINLPQTSFYPPHPVI